jgi:1-hydroxycarotenoid 3,4-desaturase
MMLDAIVIGAGVGGLVAAIDLAARGKRVVVYEAAPTPGGKIAVANVAGVEVDTGPSLLTWPAVLEGVFARAGSSFAEHVELLEPDPAFRYVWPDGTTIDLARGREGAVESIRAALGARAGRELDGFLRYAEAIWGVAVPEFVEHDAPDFFSLLRRGLPGLRAARAIDAFATMRSAILERVESRPLRAILLRFATYAGSDPRRTPATLCSIAHVEMGLGAFGVRGGMIELVRALVRLATGLGVSIHCDTPIERLATDGGRCCGVVLAGGTRVAARAVVSNADVGHLTASLLPRVLRGAVAAPGELTTSGLNLIVRDARRSGGARRAAHTVLFAHDADAEVVDLFDDRIAPREPTVYACAQEVAHGRAGWADDEPLFLMANAPPLAEAPGSGHEPDHVMSALEERMMRRMVDHSLLDATARIVWRRTPADLAARFPDSRGALYGPASHGWTAAFRRTPNVISGVPGLFVASGSAHPGGGVPLAALSGRAAARAVLGEAS